MLLLNSDYINAIASNTKMEEEKVSLLSLIETHKKNENSWRNENQKPQIHHLN